MNATILIVDDDRDMCELLAESLAPAGYDVTWRLSAEEGVVLLEERDLPGAGSHPRRHQP